MKQMKQGTIGGRLFSPALDLLRPRCERNDAGHERRENHQSEAFWCKALPSLLRTHVECDWPELDPLFLLSLVDITSIA